MGTIGVGEPRWPASASAVDGSVSVIIPAYNAERFIRRALDSVLRQTRPAHEIIVVNDGSTDQTTTIVASEFGEAVTLISQPNGGLSNARNAGLRAARGEFIALLDADDWWEAAKLERQVAVLQSHPAAVANYTGLRVFHEDSGEFTSEPPFDTARFVRELRWCNPGVPPSAMMIRRAALERTGHFNEELRACEDWDLWLRLSEIGSFTTSSEPLTDYRLSSGGLSGNADHMYNSFLQMLDGTLLRGHVGLGRTLWRRRIVSYQAFKSMLTARAAGDRVRERSYMWQSIRTWPSPFWAPERFRYFAVTLLRS